MLFALGYHDSVLRGKGQLENMFRYIADNPRRLAMKRDNPQLFRVVNSLKVGGKNFLCYRKSVVTGAPNKTAGALS